jgi:hypothetical protein
VASLSLVAYVTAIGIDCEQPIAIAIPARAAQAARLAAEPPAAPPPSAMRHGQDRSGHARAHSHAGRLAHGTAHTGSVSRHAGHHPPGHAGGHDLAARHGLGPRDPDSGESSPRVLVEDTDSSPLALVPTCLCGCSKNRSRAGGPASRLGSVVPGVALTRLPEAPPERGFAPRTPRRVGLFHSRDPIPI